jgi:GPH family glycoside/pentoside/hexuronide:cation symporter
MAKDPVQTSGEQRRAADAIISDGTVASTPAAVDVGEDIHDPSGEPLKWRERITYGLGDVGGNLIFGLITSFLLFYLTDTVGIGAAIAGTLLLLGRVMDGTMDLILGTFIDKTSTRWGKARPWIFVGAPFVVVTFVLLFNVPAGLSQTGKQAYVFVFYFLCLGVGYVASNLAYHTLLSVITSSSKMRVSLTVVRTICGLVTALTVNVITLPVIAALGGGQTGWTRTALIYGGISLITLLVVFFGTRERVQPAKETDRSAKRPVRELLRILFRNPYFYLGFVFFFLVYLLSGSAGSGVYYAKDVLGDPNAYSFLSLVTLAPLAVGIWFMPAIVARFGKRGPMLVGIAVTLVGAAITFIDPTNFTVLLTGLLIRSVGTIPVLGSLYALMADVVDYGEWKSGVRVEGMIFGAATAGQNFGAGLGAALVGWLLAAGNYDPDAATQPASAISMEIFLFLGLPAVVAVLQAVTIYFIKIDKHMTQMQHDLAARRVAASN